MRIEYDEHGNAKVIRSEHIEQPDKEKRNPHKFYDIPYLSDKVLDAFKADDEVWIEEKIDGTNVSCLIDQNGIFRCFGRNYELGDWYTNNGAYQKLLDIRDRVYSEIKNRYMLYFEYLTLHHVRYSVDKENKIYLIGIRDLATGKYLTPDRVHAWAFQLDLDTPAILYHGKFKDWKVAESLVGKSMFGAKQGEGVIVKGKDDRRGIRMVKIVADDFREIMKYDPSRIQAKLDAELAKREKAATVVTNARIRKQLYNMMDEGIISKVDGITNEEKIVAIKNIGKRIYDDCIKEEPEFVIDFGKDFGKYSFMLSKKFIESL